MKVGAMPRYFLNVRTGSGELIADLEGDELESLEASKAEALAAARDLIGNFRRLDWRGCSFEVTDEQGRAALSVRPNSSRLL